MQIQNVNSYSNNYSQKPHFTSIKSVKCEGLYKKYPELANQLVDTLKENPKAMEFCKKYDVDIVFHAIKKMQDSVESSIHIFFDNISKSKARKFLDKIAGNTDDKVVLHAWGNKYSLPESLKASTADLIEHISPERKVADGYRGGMLDSHLQSADEKIQTVLNDKMNKALKKEADLKAAKANESKLNSDSSKLQNSIDELIKKGS